LKDAHGILIQQSENVQAARQIRFTNVREIEAIETILKEYIYEAIEVEKAGLEVNFKKTAELQCDNFCFDFHIKKSIVIQCS
jgi:uncharacterized protein YdeI (YjbR/CyaY-like superfamily)